MCKTQKQRGGVVLGIGFVMALVGIGYYVNVGAQVDEAEVSWNEESYIGGQYQGTKVIQLSDIPEDADQFFGYYGLNVWYDDSSITDDVECTSYYDACTVKDAAGGTGEFGYEAYFGSHCDSAWGLERDGWKRKMASFYAYENQFPYTITCTRGAYWISTDGGLADGAKNIGQAVGSLLLAWLLFALSGIFMCIACCCFGGCCGKDAAGAYPDDVILPVTK